MKQLEADRVKVPTALETLYAPIRDELDDVEKLLGRELRSQHAFVDRLARYGFHLGGKRLRPALVLLSGKMLGSVGEEHVVLAAAMEMIHTATLIHDDVLDEATLRRHLETVNSRWDNEASVLLGDYLFARSICLISRLQDPYAYRAVSDAARLMCEGELRQVGSRGDYDLSEDEYFDIIADKTAALMACCCRVGGHYAGGDDDACDALARCGHFLGMAFQIADDLLDLVGDERAAGKSLGTDLVKQKPTLPLIRLLKQSGEGRRAELIELLSRSGNHHGPALRPYFDQSDAVAYARQMAVRFAGQAGEELASLPQSEARDTLLGLTEYVVSRNR
jgi:octaprenyl-diphosphate synthase